MFLISSFRAMYTLVFSLINTQVYIDIRIKESIYWGENKVAQNNNKNRYKHSFCYSKSMANFEAFLPGRFIKHKYFFLKSDFK